MPDSNDLVLMNPLQAEKFLILLTAGDSTRKLMTVRFVRRGRELEYMVYLPYFEHTNGILISTQHEGVPGDSMSINLTKGGGKTVSHLVKYAHHVSGEAHFSQDGKVLTRVKSTTRPLNDYVGHLFTLHFWGLDGFDIANAGDSRSSRDRRPMHFFDSRKSNVCGRIVGVARRLKDVKSSTVLTVGEWSRPIRWLVGEKPQEGLVLAPRNVREHDFLITLSYVPMDRTNEPDKTSMVFMGGFDDQERQSGSNEPAKFIMALYTDRGDEWPSLVSSLGSLDFAPDS